MAKLYEGFGENKTLRGWSKDNRCPCGFNTLKSRLNYGYSIEEAFNLRKNNAKLFKAFGEEKTLHDWFRDKRCKCEYKDLYSRIGKGWSIERAIQEEKYEINRKSEAEEYIGKEINGVKILYRKNSSKNARRVLLVCECPVCEKEFTVDFSRLKRGGIKSCSCIRKNIKEKSHAWTGHGEISRTIFSGIKSGAEHRDLEFSITIEEIWELFEKQNRRCALSGIELKFPERTKDINYNASLDRIDSSKGYFIGNVQWVDQKINYAKQQLSDRDFISMCEKVYKWNRKS